MVENAHPRNRDDRTGSGFRAARDRSPVWVVVRIEQAWARRGEWEARTWGWVGRPARRRRGRSASRLSGGPSRVRGSAARTRGASPRSRHARFRQRGSMCHGEVPQKPPCATYTAWIPINARTRGVASDDPCNAEVATTGVTSIAAHDHSGCCSFQLLRNRPSS